MEQNRSMEIAQLVKQLSQTPKSAEIVFNEYRTLWQSLCFTQTQVALLLASLPLNKHLKEPLPAYQVKPDIAAHLVSLLQQAGGRMPLGLVLKKLPAGVVTSEQQIRKLACQHSQLDIKGPLLILVN
ncbi:MAG: hypothetical protein ACRCWB_07255 [Enterovibrio sp.]